MRVVSQAKAYDRKHPTDAQYVENVRWKQGKTVFVTLNIPGGSNNDIDPWYANTHSTTWNSDQQAEMDQRTAADVRWLSAAFKKAKGAENVVIVARPTCGTRATWRAIRTTSRSSPRWRRTRSSSASRCST